MDIITFVAIQFSDGTHAVAISNVVLELQFLLNFAGKQTNTVVSLMS